MPRKAQRERRRRFVRVQKNPTPVRHEDHKAKQKYTVLSCNREKLVLRNTKKTKRLNSRIYDLKQYTSLKYFFLYMRANETPRDDLVLAVTLPKGDMPARYDTRVDHAERNNEKCSRPLLTSRCTPDLLRCFFVSRTLSSTAMINCSADGDGGGGSDA